MDAAVMRCQAHILAGVVAQNKDDEPQLQMIHSEKGSVPEFLARNSAPTRRTAALDPLRKTQPIML